MYFIYISQVFLAKIVMSNALREIDDILFNAHQILTHF